MPKTDKLETVVFSCGHLGSDPNNTHARGAVVGGNHESDLVMTYIMLAREKLLDAGYPVFLLANDYYSRRQNWANQRCNPKTTLYLECHLNAGGGRYPLVLHCDNAGHKTRELAKLFASQFTKHLLPGKNQTNYKHFLPAQVREIAEGDNGYSNISKTTMSALLLESLFMDNPAHMEIIKKPLFIASAIVEAIDLFNDLTEG